MNIKRNDIKVTRCGCHEQFCGRIDIETNNLYNFINCSEIKNNCFTLFTFLLSHIM